MRSARLCSIARAAAVMVVVLASRAAVAGKTPPLQILVEKSKVDLKAHRLEVRLSRPGKLTLTVVGESGAKLAEEAFDYPSAGAPLVVTWKPSSDEAVATIDVRATDASGAWGNVQISPWFVAIPHEDVNFATDKADIAESEVPKLEAAFAKLNEVLAKDAAHGRQHPGITLFIAGHTDTVGNAGYNLKLSQARARSIAAWFRRRGVKLPISFEGFGESALAVKTADNVDEPANRRVDYILSDDPPGYGGGVHPAWKRIP